MMEQSMREREMDVEFFHDESCTYHHCHSCLGGRRKCDENGEKQTIINVQHTSTNLRESHESRLVSVFIAAFTTVGQSQIVPNLMN